MRTYQTDFQIEKGVSPKVASGLDLEANRWNQTKSGF